MNCEQQDVRSLIHLLISFHDITGPVKLTLPEIDSAPTASNLWLAGIGRLVSALYLTGMLRLLRILLVFSWFVHPLFAQELKRVLPIGHSGTPFFAAKSKDGKRFVTIGEDQTIKLWDGYSGKLLKNIKAHNDRINDKVSVSSDGKRLLTSSFDNTIKVWDIMTGSLLLTITDNEGLVGNTLFSSDGKKILSLSGDAIRVWDAISGQSMGKMEGEHTDFIHTFTLSPDGNRLLTSSNDNSALLQDVNNGKLLFAFQKHTGAIQKAFFSASGRKIVTLSADRSVKIWDTQNGKSLFSSPISAKSIKKAALSPNEKILVTVENAGLTQAWDVATGKQLFTLDNHTGSVEELLFSPDGKHIISIGYNDPVAAVQDASTGKLLFQLKGHSGWIRGLQFLADNKTLLTWSLDNTLRSWDISTGKPLAFFTGHTSEIKNCFLSPGGKQLLSTSHDQSVKVWNPFSGNLLYDLNGHTKNVTTALYSPDGKWMLTVRDNSPELLETASGKLRLQFQGHIGSISKALFSPDSRKLLTASRDNSAVIWEVASGKKLVEYSGHTNAIITAAFSPDGKKVASSSLDNSTQIWEAATGRLLMKCRDSKKLVSVAFSPDGKTVAGMAVFDSLLLWNAITGELLAQRFTRDKPESNLLNYRNDLYYTPDGRYIITGVNHPSIRVWNAATLQLVYDFRKEDINVEGLAVSPDSKLVAGIFSSGLLQLWSLSDGGKTVWYDTYPEKPGAISFSPDSRQLVISYGEGKIESRNAVTGNLLSSFRGHTAYTGNLVFSPDGRELLSSSNDNTCRRWLTEKGKELYSFFITDSADYFIQLPSQYYFSTANATRLLHYVTPDLRTIGFEQLDIKYNRPDKVLEAIGNTDTALIKSYRKAWEKRIKKLGIDTTAFRDGYSVPEADIVNRDSIDYEQKTGTLRLHIKGVDSTYQLDRFNVWVNESPLFGQRGIRIRKKNSNTLDTTIIIQLSQGENRIETSITNVNGTESYRMPLYVNYTPAVKQKESVRFIGIGIDQFKEINYNLQYSSKDIRDLAMKLKEKYKDNIIIDTLFNENVTTEKVKALKEKLRQTSVNDKVIISYSGHGLLSKDYDYYLSTYSVNFSKPEENGLPYDELENLLDSIPVRKKLMLIDACHSGEVDKEEGVAMNKLADSLGLSKGIIIDQQQQQQHVGLKNSFELMQSLFVNVGKSTGATVISAAAGNQFALERGDLKNGVFTYSLLEVMNKYPTIKISELKKIVGERVEQLTNGMQKPTSRNENIAVDWSLW